MAEQGLDTLLTEKLLAWYDHHGRELPWRSKPGISPDPYHVWLSEIMLQQTRVATVGDYYLKFLGLWPSVADLAAASQDEVLRAWAGLGYYARARNLHACAKKVMEDWNGKFPQTETALRTLPGIGPYTAAAIASIAFGKPHAAIDGNVERVMARLYAIEQPLPAAKQEIRERTQALVPLARAGDFAQALMDLGASLCTPRSASCQICPWTEYCAGRQRGLVESLPRLLAKAKIPTRHGFVFWVERKDGFILLRRRPQKGMLGGMMEFPSCGWANPAPTAAVPPLQARWHKQPTLIEHTFTHFHLRLEIWKARLTKPPNLNPQEGYSWVQRDDLDREALPTLMRKVAAVM